MTALVEPSHRVGRTAHLGAPALAQVNLLPPEVGQERHFRRTKGILWAVLALSVILVLAGFAAAMVEVRSTRDDLAQAQAETQRLQREQARYSEVPAVIGQLDTARTARELGTSTEILWADYLGSFASTLPPNVGLDSLSVTAATPLELAPVPGDSLQPVGPAVVTFDAISATVPDTAAWVDSLNAIEGLTDARVSVSALTEEGGFPHYTITVSVRVTSEALASRFPANGSSTEDGEETR